MEIVKGMGLLLFTLGLFSLFSFKAPKGSKAMSGLANAAVATFLVEAIHKYISGDFLNFAFLGKVGSVSGSMGGVAAAILVPISMGANPLYAVVAGVALGGYGILPGFIAGYIIGLIAPIFDKKLPEGLNTIVGALLIAPLARFIAMGVDPVVNATLVNIGQMISLAAQQSPLVMGFLLGGIMKVVCTSPLSSMAVTAMLGLQGLAMGIAALACVGGSFTNGIIFKKLKLGNKSNIVA
ncbi:MAG: PTS sugar transporter subunit IIC, partial [Clostridium sporogenes]|nr:PTS sugar transporter subunit IIC [Clostridium sporogenes]